MSTNEAVKNVPVWAAGTITGKLIARKTGENTTILFTFRPTTAKHDYWVRLEGELAQVALDNGFSPGLCIMVTGTLRAVKREADGKTETSWQIFATRLGLDLTDFQEDANESET